MSANGNSNSQAGPNRRGHAPLDFSWVHELAKNEVRPEEANIFNRVNQFDPRQLIEESTIEFLEELRDLFTMNIKVFNNYSENNTKFSEIKIYGISQTPADFMLFRNNTKLVFSNSAHGIISAVFSQHSGAQNDSARGTSKDLSSASSGGALTGSSVLRDSYGPGKNQQDIMAEVGPFLDIRWAFQGESVRPERLVKFYFIEFIKASRTLRKDKSPNQLLLKQIKALLKDEGLDL